MPTINMWKCINRWLNQCASVMSHMVSPPALSLSVALSSSYHLLSHSLVHPATIFEQGLFLPPFLCSYTFSLMLFSAITSVFSPLSFSSHHHSSFPVEYLEDHVSSSLWTVNTCVSHSCVLRLSSFFPLTLFSSLLLSSLFLFCPLPPLISGGIPPSVRHRVWRVLLEPFMTHASHKLQAYGRLETKFGKY